MPFKKAVKHEAKLRLAIMGPSGSGKTYTALTLANVLGDKIAVIDSEAGSTEKYGDLFDFDLPDDETNLKDYSVKEYIRLMGEAYHAGYEVLVMDSISHAWMGAGGVLEFVDETAERMKSPNTFAAWRDGTKMQNLFIQAIVRCPMHLICTMRSKTTHISEKDDSGRTTIKNVGLQPVQRDGMEYEFDILMDMDVHNKAIVVKSRMPELQGKIVHKPDGEFFGPLKEWLKGAPPTEAKPKPEAQEEAQPELAPSTNGASPHDPLDDPEAAGATELFRNAEGHEEPITLETLLAMIEDCETEQAVSGLFRRREIAEAYSKFPKEDQERISEARRDQVMALKGAKAQ